MALNRDDFNRGDFTTGDLVSAGLKPPGGGGASPFWHTDASASTLIGAYDLRDDGAGSHSTLTKAADDTLYQISDLSGNGNTISDVFGASTNTSRAKCVEDTAVGFFGMRCPGQQSGETQFYRYLYDYATAFGSASNQYHFFHVIRHTNSYSGSSGALGAGMRFPGGDGTDGRPWCEFNACGPDTTHTIGTLVDGGGSQMSYTSAMNLGNLCGRVSDGGGGPGTIPNPVVALIEWRNDPTAGLQQLWINGYKWSGSDWTAKSGGETHGQVRMGTDTVLQVVGSNVNWYYAWAVGEPDNGFTQANAALVRAAIMADFGIPTWDGSTYPS